jgi:hypothetical protein
MAHAALWQRFRRQSDDLVFVLQGEPNSAVRCRGDAVRRTARGRNVETLTEFAIPTPNSDSVGLMVGPNGAL